MGSILGIWFGVFLIWWGLYGIRNGKMMWFSRTPSKGGSVDTRAKSMGYFLVGYGVISIVAALMTFYKK
jgi:hypothetical protein